MRMLAVREGEGECALLIRVVCAEARHFAFLLSVWIILISTSLICDPDSLFQ